MQNLAIFDLDNTLLAGDSDYLWGQYLVDQGIVDGTRYERENARFFADYEAGRLDLAAYIAFSFSILAQHEVAQLEAWRADWVERSIRPIIAPGAAALIHEHQQAGDELLIISATNSFITAPIAGLLGVQHILGTDPEFVDGRFTGGMTGTPCFREGKVERLQQWLEAQRSVDRGYGATWFYSDSINDAPLLEAADHARAVDPCPRLQQLAEQRGWPILSLRADQSP